uniref:Chromo domain-containing protein n=1 Tax=Glossina austeni TaxID=7395 RepID=A0A1A9V1I0_GLOAU
MKKKLRSVRQLSKMVGKHQKMKILECLESLENIEDEETMETIQYTDDDQADDTEADNSDDVIDEINETGAGTSSNEEIGRNENVDMLPDFNEAKDGELKIDKREETRKMRARAVVKTGGNQSTGSKASSASGARKRKNNIKDGGVGGKKPKKSAEQEYEVEEILGHKKVHGIHHFLMRWKGFTKDHDTWEPEYALNCPDILEKYEKKNGLNLTKPDLKKGAIKRQNRTVDKIIDYTDKRSGRVFRVRWKGFTAEHDTWEAEKDLTCAALIEKFMERIKSQKEDLHKEEAENVFN